MPHNDHQGGYVNAMTGIATLLLVTAIIGFLFVRLYLTSEPPSPTEQAIGKEFPDTATTADRTRLEQYRANEHAASDIQHAYDTYEQRQTPGDLDL
jgi:hypothetical protein